MDEGVWSETNASGDHQGVFQKLSVRRNAAQGRLRRCIDVAWETCNEVHDLIRTWRESHWHLPGRCLRLNKRKCEDLQQYLERTRTSYTASTSEAAAAEYLVAVRRAKRLVEESAHSHWLLKAVELWDCSEHFVEVFLDLCWASHVMGAEDRMAREQEWLLGSRRRGGQAALRCDDSERLAAMVHATLRDGALMKGSSEHHLALLLEDRLYGRSTWHPPVLTSFTFSLRTRFRLLKAGASGAVLTFPWVYSKLFAVKMRHRSTSVLRTFRAEFDLLDRYRSPYIVRVVGYWELDSCPFLLMEAMECDLEALTRRALSPLEVVKLMLPVAKALRFLHAKDVAHRDVKLQNIMCSNVVADLDDAVVKLIDFGEAVEGVSQVPPHLHRPAGTKGFMDPEMWKGEYRLFPADVFSFAMVFAGVLAPWGAVGREAQERLNLGERPPLPAEVPECVRFIVRCCWCAEPAARPSFTDVCSMLQNAKLLLLDEGFFGGRDDLFCYLDGGCIERSIFDTEFLE